MHFIGRVLNTLLLLACFTFALAWGQAGAAQNALGQGIAFQWYADVSGSMTVDQFLALLNEKIKTSDRVLSLGYTRSALWVRFFAPVGSEARWLQLRPNFLDDVTLFYRPVAAPQETENSPPWVVRQTGDRWPQARGEIDYRFPVYVLPALS